jgi:hypothetical protein
MGKRLDKNLNSCAGQLFVPTTSYQNNLLSTKHHTRQKVIQYLKSLGCSVLCFVLFCSVLAVL